MLIHFLRRLAPSWALVRVTAYGVFAFLVLATFAARVLYADVKEAALSLGHELASIADLVQGSETILLNGERMHHSSTYVDEELSSVLDRLEAYCAASPQFLGRALANLPPEAAVELEKKVPSRSARLGIIRHQKDRQGMVGCFVDDRPAGLADIKDRLERFMSTMRLGEFGRFRYFYAEQKPGASTHVTSTWADTGLDLRAMFPREGDALGADSRVIPRPPNARLTLSAAAEGAPYGLRMYATAERASVVKAFYEKAMKDAAFERIEVPNDGAGTAAFMRGDGYQAFISIGASDGQTFVTLTEAGRTDRPNVAAVQVTSD
jgi:hypothetical protein